MSCAIPGCPETDLCAVSEAKLCYPHFHELWAWLQEQGVGPDWSKREGAINAWISMRQAPRRKAAGP
jgi:hypothetical protein